MQEKELDQDFWGHEGGWRDVGLSQSQMSAVGNSDEHSPEGCSQDMANWWAFQQKAEQSTKGRRGGIDSIDP